MGSPSVTLVVGSLNYRFRTESFTQGSRGAGWRGTGGSFQPESYLPKGGASPCPPHPPQQEATASPSPAGRSQKGTATEPWAGRGSGQRGRTQSLSGLPRSTHSIEEVSELVLFKTSSQKVIWGLQDTLFEPEGGRLLLARNAHEHCCEGRCLPPSPAAPPHPQLQAHLSRHLDPTRTFVSSPVCTIPGRGCTLISQNRRLRSSPSTPRRVDSTLQGFLNSVPPSCPHGSCCILTICGLGHAQPSCAPGPLTGTSGVT